MDLQKLRLATHSDHEATEELLPLMSPQLTRDAYVASLRQLYAIVRSWDEWSAAHVPAWLADELTERQRSALLAQDLAFFGAHRDTIDIPAFRVDWQPAATDAWLLGAMYVVEGSTLGGQYIAAHVEQVFGLTPGIGDAYFRSYGAETGARWNAFKAILRNLPDSDEDAVIEGARYCFRFFREALSKTR